MSVFKQKFEPLFKEKSGRRKGLALIGVVVGLLSLVALLYFTYH